MTPLHTGFISPKHNRQRGLISMCPAVHMSIKLRNQAAEQRHGKMLTDILFNLPNVLRSLQAVVCDNLMLSIRA